MPTQTTATYVETRKGHYLSLWREYDRLVELRDGLSEEVERRLHLVEELIGLVATDLRQQTKETA